MIIAVVFVFWLLFVELRTTGARHTPALYFLLYMSTLMIVCDLLAGVAPFSEAGFFYLAVVSGAFWLGHLCGALVFGGSVYPGGAPAQDGGDDGIIRLLGTPPIPRSLEILTIAGLAAGILAIVALWQAARSAGIFVTSFEDLGRLPAYFSQVRYTAGAEDAEPITVRFFMLILEAGSTAAGLLRASKATPYRRLLQTSPLIVAFVMTLMTGIRSYLFLNCTWYFGAFITVLCVQGSVFTQLRSLQFLTKAGLFLVVAFLFGSAFAILRYEASSLQAFTFDQFMSELLPLMASSLEAIVTATLVFDRVSQVGVPLHLAAYTFAPVTAWLGWESVRYPPTVYLSNGLSDSNQYALVGFLLLDFGPFLTAGIFALTGFLAAGAVYLVRAGMISVLPFLIAILCVVLFSLIGNFFFFTTHVALFVGMTLVGIALQRMTLRSARA